jgi:hypothetical protein
MPLTNCRCCLRSPALRPSWASVARRRIDSQRRASCRCAGSAVVSTSSPQSFESWSHHERIGLSGRHPLSAVGQWQGIGSISYVPIVSPADLSSQCRGGQDAHAASGTALTARPSATPFPGSARGSRCRASRSYTAYGQSGPPMTPGCGAAYRLAGARCSAHR